uniref:Uncharacterized protein n=1 Tax=Anopheles melas TaxID=34690 RepID=A0A182TDJ8_9DIPT
MFYKLPSTIAEFKASGYKFLVYEDQQKNLPLDDFRFMMLGEDELEDGITQYGAHIYEYYCSMQQCSDAALFSSPFFAEMVHAVAAYDNSTDTTGTSICIFTTTNSSLDKISPLLLPTLLQQYPTTFVTMKSYVDMEIRKLATMFTEQPQTLDEIQQSDLRIMFSRGAVDIFSSLKNNFLSPSATMRAQKRYGYGVYEHYCAMMYKGNAWIAVAPQMMDLMGSLYMVSEPLMINKLLIQLMQHSPFFDLFERMFGL